LLSFYTQSANKTTGYLHFLVIRFSSVADYYEAMDNSSIQGAGDARLVEILLRIESKPWPGRVRLEQANSLYWKTVHPGKAGIQGLFYILFPL
jgi:hypothetical protein